MSGLPLTLALREPIEAALTRLREGSAEQCLSDHAFSNLYLFQIGRASCRERVL